MQNRFRRPAVVFASAFALFLTAGPGAASTFECEQQINTALQESGVDQSNVKSVNVARRTGGAKSAGIYTLDAWVRLNSCSNGALIVNLTKYCMVNQVFTTGDCSVAGLPRY